MRYRVNIWTTSSAGIIVEADDEEAAIEAAMESTPSICAQCSGWGRDNFYLDLGEEWNLDDREPVERLDDDG